MKLRTLSFTLLLMTSSLAQEAAPPRELIVAAIGEIPVPRMKVTEAMGFRGYIHDEESTNRWFPQDWTIAGKTIRLALNIEPVTVKIPATGEPFDLAPKGVAPKPQTLPPADEGATTLMVIFNRDGRTPWREGFAARFVRCRRLDPASPSAVVLNLSGAVVSVAERDRSIRQVAPGKSASAAAFVSPDNGVRILPLSASVAGKNHLLNIAPIDVRAPWCPVVAIYPGTGPSSKARPLRVSVIQPSDAVATGPQNPPAGKGAPP